MLESVVFKNKFRIFAKGEKFEFKPGINLLTGDQGSGKSSLLFLLSQNRKDTVQINTVGNKAVESRSFDFEKDNPRLQSLTGGESEYNSRIRLMFSSHGESVNAVINAAKQWKAPLVILMDEPDMALSPRSIKKLVETYRSLADAGMQIIAAVHNPIIIGSVEQVLSLEHRKWMLAKEFLASHLD